MSTAARPHRRGSRVLTGLFLVIFVVVIGFAFTVLSRKSQKKPVVFPTVWRLISATP